MDEGRSSFIERAAKLEVLARDGRAVELGSVLLPGPALLLFLRHFGCVGCEMQVTAVLPRQPELSALGVEKLVLLGSGPPAHVQGFVERYGLDERGVVVVVDPSLAAFAAAGLRRSVWATFGPMGVLSEVLAIGAGHPPRRRYGDRYQQGGALLLDERGDVVFHHANRFIADCARTEDLVDAAMRLRLRSAGATAARGIV